MGLGFGNDDTRSFFGATEEMQPTPQWLAQLQRLADAERAKAKTTMQALRVTFDADTTVFDTSGFQRALDEAFKYGCLSFHVGVMSLTLEYLVDTSDGRQPSNGGKLGVRLTRKSALEHANRVKLLIGATAVRVDEP